MLDLPATIITVLRAFEPVFSERVWEWAKVLLVGAILAPGKRTVTSALRVMGLSDEAQYQNYHRVLNRAVWSSRCLSERLLRQLVAVFVPLDGPLVLLIRYTHTSKVTTWVRLRIYPKISCVRPAEGSLLRA
jgi:hypothetical protein